MTCIPLTFFFPLMCKRTKLRGFSFFTLYFFYPSWHYFPLHKKNLSPLKGIWQCPVTSLNIGSREDEELGNSFLAKPQMWFPQMIQRLSGNSNSMFPLIQLLSDMELLQILAFSIYFLVINVFFLHARRLLFWLGSSFHKREGTSLYNFLEIHYPSLEHSVKAKSENSLFLFTSCRISFQGTTEHPWQWPFV